MNTVDLAHRPTADPLLRLLAHGFATAYHHPPGAVWHAPYAFHLSASAVPPGPQLPGTTPRTDWVAAANWSVGVAVAPRADGMLRCGSLNHPADGAELPLTGPPTRAPGWAARPYAALRALAAAGYGRGGADLHLNAVLPAAVGLPVAESLECAVALAVAGVHAERGGRPLPRARLAELLGAAVPGDDALRRAVLFARSGHLLAADGSTYRPLPAQDGGPDPCLLLLTARITADGHEGAPTAAGDTALANGIALAVREALRAGARSAWWPRKRPGRSVLLLAPRDRRAAIRTAAADAFARRGLPVPRFLRIALAAAADRADRHPHPPTTGKE
ncbi:galactokinase [Streptomyces inhibens]|uniref:galactokinase n=1 Tax=Streptomyces inhibens TaxID=2293571 RepID=UPI00402A80F3